MCRACQVGNRKNHHSPERNRKVSVALAGKPLTEEHRRKISLSKKGKPNPNLSKAKKGKPNLKRRGIVIPQAVEAAAQWHRENPPWNKGLTKENDTRVAKLSLALLGRPKSEEHVRKVTQKLKGRPVKYSYFRDDPNGRIIGKTAFKGRHHRPESKTKMLQSLFATLKIKPNKPERALGQMLETLFPGHWKYSGDGGFIVGGMCPDFTNLNSKKQVIELFGDYWHQGENPQDRIDTFKRYGFNCLVIWESELKDKENLCQKLHNFHQS